VTGFTAAAGLATRDGGLTVATVPTRLRLLLVDDDEINRDIVLLMLDRLDQHADAAGNGIEALAAVRSMQYDVVLMDIHMPGMDGLEATCRIRSELSETVQPAIIAMTANVTVEDHVVFLRTGMDDVLSKPVRMRELAAVLENRGPRDGGAIGLVPDNP